MTQEQLDKKTAKEAEILKKLQDRYDRYVEYIKVDKNPNPSPVAKRFVFGNAFTGKICIALMVLLTMFFVVSILVLVKTNGALIGFITVPICYVTLSFFLICAIIQHFQEGKIIEADKAEEAVGFALEEEEEKYIVHYEVTTKVTGSLLMEGEVTKEMGDHIKKVGVLPVKIAYGRGLVYNIDFAKIRKDMEKTK